MTTLPPPGRGERRDRQGTREQCSGFCGTKDLRRQEACCSDTGSLRKLTFDLDNHVGRCYGRDYGSWRLLLVLSRCDCSGNPIRKRGVVSEEGGGRNGDICADAVVFGPVYIV
ncbi:hypothetical protein PspLS_01182 [Pyricularia sp. CBS 133598]|nr:hypothetical protein PspLS_01182 [Pyricularia sp. CBS 133598]